MDNEELTAHLDSSALSGRQLLEEHKTNRKKPRRTAAFVNGLL